MSKIVRKVATVTAAASLVVGVGVPVIERHTRTVRSCVAHIDVYEDGSWGGQKIVSAKGTEIAPRWDVTGPELQNTVTPDAYGVPTYHSDWPVSQNGKPCKIVIG